MGCIGRMPGRRRPAGGPGVPGAPGPPGPRMSGWPGRIGPRYNGWPGAGSRKERRWRRCAWTRGNGLSRTGAGSAYPMAGRTSVCCLRRCTKSGRGGTMGRAEGCPANWVRVPCGRGAIGAPGVKPGRGEAGRGGMGEPGHCPPDYQLSQIPMGGHREQRRE